MIQRFTNSWKTLQNKKNSKQTQKINLQVSPQCDRDTDYWSGFQKKLHFKNNVSIIKHLYTILIKPWRRRAVFSLLPPGDHFLSVTVRLSETLNPHNPPLWKCLNRLQVAAAENFITQKPQPHLMFISFNKNMKHFWTKTHKDNNS